MGRLWKIQRAAVEQEILFPTEKIYKNYLNTLEKREEPYEIMSEKTNEDGSIVVIMRKRYNYNAFLDINTN